MKEYISDHTLLIESIAGIINEDSIAYTVLDFNKSGYACGIENKKKKSRGDFVVLGEDTAIELGSPGTLSVSRFLWTGKQGLVKDRAYIIGDRLGEFTARRVSFLQFVITELDEGALECDDSLYSKKNLSNRIPGYMTRTLPGKIWVRIHRDLMQRGFSLSELACELHDAYCSGSHGVKKSDVILVAGNDSVIEKFIKISEAASLISTENRKKRWIEEGVLNCDDLNCDSCEEQSGCNTIREAIQMRRNTNNE